MNKTVKLFNNVIPVFIVIPLYVFIALLCVYTFFINEDIIYGFSKESIGGSSLRKIAGWLVILFIPHIINGLIIERCNRISVFSCIRMRSILQFENLVYTVCFLNSFLWSFIIIAIHIFVSKEYLIELFFVLSTHILMWTALLISLYSLTNKKTIAFAIAPLICVLSIGISNQCDNCSGYMISSLGMLRRSSLYIDNGTPSFVQVISNIIIIFLCRIVIYVKNSIYLR